MADQFENNPALATAEPKGKKLKIAFIIAGAVVLIAALTTVAIFWPKNKTPNSSAPPPAVVTPPANVPPAPVPEKPVEKPANIPAIPPGVDRPLTTVEKQKYGFATADNIWMKTSSPSDGSQPSMSFYNKTVNPNPYPTAPVIIPGD